MASDPQTHLNVTRIAENNMQINHLSKQVSANAKGLDELKVIMWKGVGASAFIGPVITAVLVTVILKVL